MNKAAVRWMAWLALAAGLTLNPAPAATLKVGDPAPKLQVAKWVQGEPVKEFQRDTAYIVEFWATWCGPCRVSIPHLNEIHKKFKDKGLVVIGQDSFESEEGKVEPFVKDMGEKMTYRVAMDDGQHGTMAQTWMDAANQPGIPTAFVVNKQGIVAWIGHPMEINDETVQQVLDGSYDITKAAAESARRAKLMKLSGQWSNAMKDKNWDDAESALDQIEKLLPEGQRSSVSLPRLKVLLSKGDTKAASKLASQVSDSNKDKAMMQNDLAWEMLTHKDVQERDLDLAYKIAVRANDAAQGKNPAILDTLARALFMQDQKDKAIELQEKAVALAADNDRASYRKTLNSYKEGKLPKAQE